MKKLFLLILLPLLAICSCDTSTTVDNSTVSHLNVQRFVGPWYEIARFDHRFERGMTHCRTTYTITPKNTIQVKNRGLKDGEWKERTGIAKSTPVPGLFRVSFFWIFYSDYRIMMIDRNYTYALIGSDSSDYLWILARKPSLPKSTLDIILREARFRGYDTSRLIWVDQKKSE